VRETLSIRYQLEVVNATDDAIGFDNTLVFDATF
jgi:hypothetical protein